MALLDPSAFDGCDALKVKENGLTYVDRWVLDCDTDITEIIWKNGTVGIASSAFEGCTALTVIAVPDSVAHVGFYVFDGCTAIEQYFFQGCTKLESVALPNTITKIGEMAFGGCRALTNLTLSKNLAAIPYQAFKDCTSLETLAIPASVKTIAIQAFYNCPNLTQRVDNVDYVDTWAIGSTARIEQATLRDGTVGIADEAFKERSRLTTLVMPDSMLYVGNYSFEGCVSLRSLTLSPVLKSFAFRSFHACVSLTSLEIPETVETVKMESFTACTRLLRKAMYRVTYVDRWVVACDSDATFTVLTENTVGVGPLVFGENSPLETVFYEGDAQGFAALRIDGSGNGVLSKVTVAFLSEEAPTAEGTYWHYVKGVPTLWE